MSDNSNWPAFPVPEQRGPDGCGLVEGAPGLSKREYELIAYRAAALTGTYMHPNMLDLRPETRAMVAEEHARAMYAAAHPEDEA